MKIAYIHDQVTVNGGGENTLREMIRLYPDAPIYCTVVDREVIKWLDEREVHTTLIQKLPLGQKKHYYYSPIIGHLTRDFDLTEYDVLLVDSHAFAHQARKRPGALMICYYHTPARALWLPEIDDRAASGRLAWLKKMFINHIKVRDLEASKNPDVIIANSYTVADRIKRFYGREVDHVIYPPVPVQKWFDVKRESDDEGWLFWGRLIRYKRLDIAIEAAKAGGWRLNVVGGGPFEAEYKQMAAGAPNIRFHGRLPDEELKKLMSRSRGVIFPPFEDFGIVPVEALAAGLPVVAFAKGGASESIRPEHGRLFLEQTPQSLQEAIDRMGSMVFDPAVLQHHAEKFDIPRFDREYADAVSTAISKHTQK